ncbi:MAG TPA: B12 lower ligand biosynthesis ThiC-like protein BzaB, partial [Armatimonadetes bacterium]|nr:B12 lower ligand biosynthesis ThiC-like protein BzaB [Armatimonadota bacterium]
GVEEVREGIIAARIAAHAGDIAKGIPGAAQWDLDMSKARKARDWKRQEELSIDPQKFKKYRKERGAHDEEVCSMCSQFCAMKVVEEYLRKK